MKRYTLKESFYSLQGEGVRAGTPAVFFRFSGCNLACNRSTHSFDCDTDFVGGEKWSAEELVERAHALGSDGCRWIILTGGEPALQLDAELIRTLKKAGYRLAIETNGTRELPEGLDWICVSPKVAEDRLAQRRADELKYVLREGDPLPQPTVEAKHLLLSPAFDGVTQETLETASPLPLANLRWCASLCLKNPPWRLSVQQHKLWGVH
jgi:7-carboxy-7-deazaguanine synthase